MSDDNKKPDKITCFLYVLMKDYLPAGKIEEIIEDRIMPGVKSNWFSNPHIYQYAKELADKLKKED